MKTEQNRIWGTGGQQTLKQIAYSGVLKFG